MSKFNKKGSNQALEGSVVCPGCKTTFLSFVNFELEMDGSLDFQMNLFEHNDEELCFVRHIFAYKQQNDMEQRSRVECPKCPKTFELYIHLIKTIKESQLKIRLSITTYAIEKKEEEKTQRGKKDPPEQPDIRNPLRRRVKVFYKCSGETFRGDHQVKEQLMMHKWQILHVQETNLKDSDIVIVFCPITSRVGSDVESCMGDEAVSSLRKPIILVLMHHTRDPDYSTAGTVWSETYPKVVLDVHVLFHETIPGLLRCRQNDEALAMIKTELNKHSKSLTRILTHHHSLDT